MSSILKSIHKLEDRFDNRAERFAFRHPHAAVLAMFIGLPVFILAARISSYCPGYTTGYIIPVITSSVFIQS